MDVFFPIFLLCVFLLPDFLFSSFCLPVFLLPFLPGFFLLSSLFLSSFFPSLQVFFAFHCQCSWWVIEERYIRLFWFYFSLFSPILSFYLKFSFAKFLYCCLSLNFRILVFLPSCSSTEITETSAYSLIHCSLPCSIYFRPIGFL